MKNNGGFMALGMTVLVSIGIYGIIEATLYKNVIDNAINQMDQIMESMKENEGNYEEPKEEIYENYIVKEDGTKINVNENVKNTSVNIGNVTIYGFEIECKNGLSTVKCKIKSNTAEEKINSYKISLYDSNDNLIKEYIVLLASGVDKPTMSVTSIMEDASDTSRIEIQEYIREE